MKNHTKVYFKAFGYDTNSWIACEVCGSTAVDIHHIESRGMGGSKHADTIENLMALCRTCHTAYGDIKEHKERLQATHNHHLAKRVI
jgi:5-methylcytosine-specific restriction endonuclease McrA